MELIWFLIGIIGMGGLWGISTWIKKKQTKLSWVSWVGIVLTMILGLFTLAWCLSSIWEKEYQAAGVGLLIFGTLSLVGMGFTRKSVHRNLRK
ncbi:MAG: hypothetical protein GQ544_08835, partial [Candidatus Aminicenantes bacterium]|nr:hypothetical protein [Candidatus Aminicenantes bacterium]